jgi:hypothetical protein
MSNISVNTGKPVEPAAPAAPAPVEAVEQVDADLDVLIQQGVVERTVAPFNDAVLKNCRITMHTLLNPERVEVSKEIPNEEIATFAVSEQAPKKPTLLYAITCIEMSGKKYMFDTPASKAALRVMLDKMSGVMIDMLYLEYLRMTNDLIKIIETGVKKN